MKPAPTAALIALVAALFPAAPLAAQTTAPFEDTPEAHYFDFWPGTWVEVVDGVPDTSATRFEVRRSVHPAAYDERWRLVVDGTALHATALRAWDRVAGRWMFTWVSDNGLYQVWEGRRFGDDWYIVREFEIDDERFLSRQAWIPRGDDELVRVMDRSFDDGRTWDPRSRTVFRRVAEHAPVTAPPGWVDADPLPEGGTA